MLHLSSLAWVEWAFCRWKALQERQCNDYVQLTYHPVYVADRRDADASAQMARAVMLEHETEWHRG